MKLGSPPKGGLGALSHETFPQSSNDNLSHTLSHSVGSGNVPRHFGDEEQSAFSQTKQFQPAVSCSLSKRIHRSRDSRLARSQKRITLRRQRRVLYRQWKQAVKSSLPHTSSVLTPPTTQAGRTRDTCMPAHIQSQYDLANTHQNPTSATPLPTPPHKPNKNAPQQLTIHAIF